MTEGGTTIISVFEATPTQGFLKVCAPQGPEGRENTLEHHYLINLPLSTVIGGEGCQFDFVPRATAS